MLLGDGQRFSDRAQPKPVRWKTPVSSHLLPTYARVDLAFERGEGVWLFTAAGERYLDFASGIAVNALGHAHPQLVEALSEQAGQALARLQPLPHSRRRAAGRAAVRGKLRRHRVLPQFRRRGGRVLHQDGAQIPVGERASRALSHHHLRGRLPRPHARHHRRHRQPEISRRLRPAGRRLRPGAVRRPGGGEEGDRACDRRHHHRADPGRGRRARAAAAVPARLARTVRRARPAADLRRGADRHRPHRQTVLL